MGLGEVLDGMSVGNNGSEVELQFGKLMSALADEKNIEIKTDLEAPLALTQLRAWGRWAEKSGFTGSKKIIEDFIADYCMYRVSYHRQGRSELVKAISQIKEIVSKGLLGKSGGEGVQ